MLSSDKQNLKNLLAFYIKNEILNQINLQTIEDQNDKILQTKVEHLKKQFSKEINFLNEANWKSIFESKNNLTKIISERNKLKNDLVIKENKQQYLLTEIFNQKKIKSNLLMKKLNNYFIAKNIKIETHILHKIEKIENIFVHKNKNIEKKLTNLTKKEIAFDVAQKQKDQFFNKIFNEKNMSLNIKIKDIKNKLQTTNQNISNAHKHNQDLLDQSKKQIIQNFNTQINDINSKYQQKLAFHNQCFDLIQKEYLNKVNNYQHQLQKIFVHNNLTLLDLFVDVVVNPKLNTYKRFVELFNHKSYNEMVNLKNLTLWRKNYSFIKLSHQKDIQICNLMHYFEIKKINFATTQDKTLLLQQKEKLLSLIKIAFLQLQIKLFLNSQKKQNNLSDMQTYIKKEEIKYNQHKLYIEKDFLLNEMEYQKQLSYLDKTYRYKKNLLILQLKLEKNKFQLKDFEKINHNDKQIIILEHRIDDLKIVFKFNKKTSAIVDLQEKKNFSFKYQHQEKNIAHLIAIMNLEYNNMLQKIFNFVDFNLKSDHFISSVEAIYMEIQNQLNVIITHLDVLDNNICYKDLEIINDLCQFFIKEIFDVFYNKYYLFYNQQYLIQKFQIDNEIVILKKVIKYYENNLYFIQQIIQKKQDIFYNHKYYLNYILEKKIKKYEKHNFTLKKQLKKLYQQSEQLNNEHSDNILYFKNKQNNIVSKNNHLQIQLLHYFEKLNLNQQHSNCFAHFKQILLKNKILRIVKKIHQHIMFSYLYCQSNVNKIILFINKLKVKDHQIDILKHMSFYQERINFFYNAILDIIENINKINVNYKHKQHLKQEILLKQQKDEVNYLNIVQWNKMKSKTLLIEENLKEAIFNINQQFQDGANVLNNQFQTVVNQLNLKMNTKWLYFVKIKQAQNNNQFFLKQDFGEIKNNLLKEFRQKQLQNDKLIKKIDNALHNKEMLLKRYNKEIFYVCKIKIFFLFIRFRWKKYIKKREIKKNRFKVQKQIQKNLNIEKKIYLWNLQAK